MNSRRLSIDLLRGLTVMAMLLVNNPGSWAQIYAPLKHAEWHGLTPTDLVFPFFLFLVGVSLTLSSRLQKIPGRDFPLREVLTRSGKLIACGLFLALFNYKFLQQNYSWWQDTFLALRFPGVLQRIAVVYAACALLHWFCSSRQLLLLSGLILLGYGTLLSFAPVPGVMAGETLLPAKNLPAWLDSQLFGTHVYWRNQQPWAGDPEGLLSSFPAVVTGIAGLLFGRALLNGNVSSGVVMKSMLKSAGIVLALLLAGVFWHQVLPINKNLWTPAFVLISAAAALACLLILQALDRHPLGARPAWQRAILEVPLDFGSNAILAFVGSGVLARLLGMIPVEGVSLKSWLWQWLPATPFGSLLFALGFLLLCGLPLAWLRRVKGWIWKI